jgi:hypothetical protein
MFHKPALEANIYKIQASPWVLVDKKDDAVHPNVIQNKDEKDIIRPQLFWVVAPQFTLSANSIHSPKTREVQISWTSKSEGCRG